MSAAAARPLTAETPLPPLMPGAAYLGHLRRMRDNPLRLFRDAVHAYGDIVRFQLGPETAILLGHPDAIKYVLQDRHRAFGKGTPGFIKMKRVLGEGLVTSEGDFWLRQRRIAQPAFHRQRIASFAQVMVRDTLDLSHRWEALAARGQTVDVHQEMMSLTLRIVGEALLSRDLSDSAGAVSKALAVVLHHIIDRTTSPWDPPERIPVPSNRRFVKARAALDEVVWSVINERRRSGEDAGDLLSMLMKARDEETGESMTDRQLRDEVMTMFLAGHETTANALTWTFMLLSDHPEIAERLTREVRSVLKGRAPVLEDLAKLDYVRMVLDESMRLYPPAWVIARRALEDGETCGYRIPKGALLFPSPWAVHRNPRVWPQPDRFDPERFSKDRVAQHPRYAYFPFGGGPRQCIGQGFALMEAQLILATLAQNFRARTTPDYRLAMEPQVTLRAKYGLPMTITRA